MHPSAVSQTSPAKLSLLIVCLLFIGVAVVQLSAVQAADQAARPAKVAGADVCIACHGTVPAAQKENWHARLIAKRPGSSNCEECHGPSSAHTEDPGKVPTFYSVTRAPADRSAQACLTCHQDHLKPALWKSSEHARARVRCWDCHSQGSSPHQLILRRPDEKVCYACHQEQSATFELTSHHPVREGRIGCSDCHKAHEHQSEADEARLCSTCHAPQRGPFIFAHGAISGELTEGCLDCHRAHGSPNERLLKFSGRGLCLQCHADHAMHFVGRTCWASGCHAQVHGSNTSPLLLGH